MGRVTKTGVMALCGLSEATIDRLEPLGFLPESVEVEGVKHWDADEIRAWHESGHVPSRPIGLHIVHVAYLDPPPAPTVTRECDPLVGWQPTPNVPRVASQVGGWRSP